MKWKLLFLVFLVSIISTIFILNKLNFKLPQMSSVTGFFSRIFRSPEKKISLIIYSFEDYLTFSTLNNTLNFEGSCSLPIRIGKTTIQLTNYTCNLKFYEPSGELKLKNRLLNFELKSNSFEINGIIYQSEEKVIGEILVNKGNLYVSSNTLKIRNINGELEIYTVENNPSLIVKFPPCEYLELNNFVGNLKIENEKILLTGTASGKYRCQNVENKI